VRDGDVIAVQSLWATAPIIVILIEWLQNRQRPQPGVVIGSVVVALGVLLLLSTASS